MSVQKCRSDTAFTAPSSAAPTSSAGQDLCNLCPRSSSTSCKAEAAGPVRPASPFSLIGPGAGHIGSPGSDGPPLPRHLCLPAPVGQCIASQQPENNFWQRNEITGRCHAGRRGWEVSDRSRAIVCRLESLGHSEPEFPTDPGKYCSFQINK